MKASENMVSSSGIGHMFGCVLMCCIGQFMISKDSCVSFNLLADPVSQEKVFEEVTQANVKPNGHTYSELMKTCVAK